MEFRRVLCRSTATGTVSYTLFPNATCAAGTGSSAGTVTLRWEERRVGKARGALTAGSYSLQAVYSGDSNYAGSTGTCEPFSVGTGTAPTATTVFDAATNLSCSNHETAYASHS